MLIPQKIIDRLKKEEIEIESFHDMATDTTKVKLSKGNFSESKIITQGEFIMARYPNHILNNIIDELIDEFIEVIKLREKKK